MSLKKIWTFLHSAKENGCNSSNSGETLKASSVEIAYSIPNADNPKTPNTILALSDGYETITEDCSYKLVMLGI